MAEFSPITTQEEFDRAIGDRLKRERETIRKEFEGYLSPEAERKKYEGYLSPADEKKKYEGYLTPEQAAEKDKKLKAYETDSVKTRIAREMGIPYDLAGRLMGEDEASIKKDAESLAKILGKEKRQQPLRSTEPEGAEAETAAYRTMLNNLKGE